ncbi:MAG: FkbM family methyltransferase [Candidatus Micrarchaeaceae archaeon]
MSFVSYAQNFEDVMLWRALKHIEKGFYIDVGAFSPDLDSVTKAFYEKGWRGINIEPNPQLYEELLQKRSEDINLQCALSDKEGSAEMYFLPNTGLSTLDETIAKKHNEQGWNVNLSFVNICTLAKVCEKYASNKDIHFLKVDVEGYEKQVLSGNNWQRYRPWIVVVESTLPMTQIENYQDWESILLGANYIFTYADGLNRFYVANEHKNLSNAFKYPPNVFDDFVLSSVHQAKIKQDLLQNKVSSMQSKIEELTSSNRIGSRPFKTRLTSLILSTKIIMLWLTVLHGRQLNHLELWVNL